MNDKAKSDGNLIQINKPEEKYGVYRNEFNWPDLNLKVIVDRITDDGKAELSFYSGDGNEEILLHHQQVNLLASTIFRDLPKILAPQLKADGCDIDWHTVLTYVSGLTMRNLRKGGEYSISW